MKQRKNLLTLTLVGMLCLTGCGTTDTSSSAVQSQSTPATQATDTPTVSFAAEPTANSDAASQTEEDTTMENTMAITVNGQPYTVQLDANVTVADILENRPLQLELGRYAEHEYYAELPFTPTFASETTSQIMAGHVYYWDGWNAFVINYIDTDITPYKVVHIGEITDAAISAYLNNAGATVEFTADK